MGKKKKTLFNFERKFGWSEVISLIALLGAITSIFLQFNSNKPKISMSNSNLIGTNFIDKNGNKWHFGFYRTTLINNGGKSVTFTGIEPNENLGLISTTKNGSNKLIKKSIRYKIFQIHDSILVDHLINGKLLIQHQKTTETDLEIDISALRLGSYILRVSDVETGLSFNEVIVKE